MRNNLKFWSLILTLLVVGGLHFVAKQWGDLSPFSGSYKKISQPYPLAQVHGNKLGLDVQFIAGELTIFPLHSDDLAIDFNAMYKVREVHPLIRAHNEGLSIQVNPDEKWGFSGRSFWNVGLNTDLAHAVTINAKTSKQVLDFSGIPIRSLYCHAGAGSVLMLFNQPNPIEMNTLLIDTKATTCKVSGLLNARVKNCRFVGNAGYYQLEFSGEQTTTCNVVLEGHLGKTKLIFPEKLNARIVLKNSMVTIAHKHLIKRSKIEFVTSEYNPQKPVLTLYIQVGVGTLEIQD